MRMDRPRMRQVARRHIEVQSAGVDSNMGSLPEAGKLRLRDTKQSRKIKKSSDVLTKQFEPYALCYVEQLQCQRNFGGDILLAFNLRDSWSPSKILQYAYTLLRLTSSLQSYSDQKNLFLLQQQTNLMSNSTYQETPSLTTIVFTPAQPRKVN